MNRFSIHCSPTCALFALAAMGFIPVSAQDSIQVEGAILKTIEATTLAAQVSGVIDQLATKEGDIIEAGKQLGKIRDEAVRLKLEQLQTQVELAKKKQANDINQRLAENSQEVARNEYQRALSANQRVPNTYPVNEIDRLQLVADQSQLELERAKYERDLAQFDVTLAVGEYRQAHELYNRHRIIAPASGVVVAVEKRAGEWVEPGTDLLRVVRIDQLRLEGFISADQAQRELVGRPATIKLPAREPSSPEPASPEPASYTGAVVFVSPDVNPVNGQVRIFIEVDNASGRLRPGLRVDTQIDVK